MSGEEFAKFFWKRAAVFGTAGVVLYFTNQESTPVTNRTRLILFPSWWESSLGDMAKKEVLEGERTYPPDHPRAQAVQAVVDKLVAQVGNLPHLPQHLKNVEWTVTVVESNKVNALAAPGGKIVVFTGIMDALRSETELAAVIAHEMAHVLARHSAEKITAQALLLPLWIAAAYVLEAGGLFSTIHRVLVALPASRAAESEADAIGMQLAARACFHPSGMIKMLTKLERLEKMSGAEKPPALLSTHPLTSERIDAAKRMLPEAVKVMELSACSAFSNLWGTATLGSAMDSTVFDGSTMAGSGHWN